MSLLLFLDMFGLDWFLISSRQAVSLDSHFAYAHTLLGHEHAVNEEFEKAAIAFRTALSRDDRHYNAWYASVFFVVVLFVCGLTHGGSD